MHIFFQRHRYRRGRILLAAVLLGSQVAYGEQPSAAMESVSQCLPEGLLAVALYGGIQAKLDWSAADLECGGMPRPNAEGARLHFSGTSLVAGKSRHIAIIISLPELKRGETVQETPANVTIMEEDSGRFFSSSEASFCLSDIGEQKPNGEGEQDKYLISGILNCVAALAELNGSGGVLLGDLRFSGQLDWQIPE